MFLLSTGISALSTSDTIIIMITCTFTEINFLHTLPPAGADCHDVDDQHWINGHPTPIANPMSAYPRYQQYRKSWGINALGSVIVEVETEDGTTGVGEFKLLASTLWLSE